MAIIEGEYDPVHLYPQFKEDYIQDKMTVDEIKKKYNINAGQYKRFRNAVVKETGFEKRPNRKNPKFYTKYKNGFTVCRKYNGKYIHGGKYRTEEDAKKVAEFLKDNDWDTTNLDEFRKKNNIPYGPKNYRKYEYGYAISKHKNGKKYYFGTFPTEKEAQKAVEWLREHDWNKKRFEEEYL